MSQRRFRPNWLPLIITLSMLILLVFLGSWQISRSREKQRLLETYQSAPVRAEVTSAELESDWELYKYRRIVLKGYYDTEHQVLMDNQIRNGTPGYLVLTPFMVNGGDVVLVNRGWIAKTAKPNLMPSVALDMDVDRTSGLVGTPPGVGFQMGSLDAGASSWPRPVPYIDMDWLQLQLGAEVKPWVVLLGRDQPNGYLREWKPALKMGPEKHRGYALTWFSLAIALLFLFVLTSLKGEEGVVVLGEGDESKEDERS